MKENTKHNIRFIKIIVTTIFLSSFTILRAQIVNIGHDKILINGIQFDSTSLINDYIKVLGQPSRVVNLANNIYVFDSLGIYIYENYKDGNRIIELSFDFKKNRDYDFSPRRRFSSKIFLADNYNYRVSRHTSYKRLKRMCDSHKNNSLKMEFGDSELNYGNFSLLFEHNFFRTSTKNFTLDFRVRKNKYIE